MLVYNPTAKISKYFRMCDVAKSNIALRHSIDNTPSSKVLESAEALANNVLDPIFERYAIGFIPEFWYRCEELEKLVSWRAYLTWTERKGIKQNDESWEMYLALKSHPKGEAVDIVIPGISPLELFNVIQVTISDYDQLILEYSRPDDLTSGYVHVSYSLERNRKEAFKVGTDRSIYE